MILNNNAPLNVLRWDRCSLDEGVTYLLRTRLARLLPEPQADDPDLTAVYRTYADKLKRQIEALKIRRDASKVPDDALDSDIAEREMRRRFMLCRLFPIDSLPNEILTEIFRFASWSANHPCEGINQRLWLTWVCRRWRSAALADMTLWNAVWFRDSWPFTRSLTWLDRAGTAPLDIRLWGRDNLKPGVQTAKAIDAEEANAIMDHLVPRLGQIRMFIAMVDDWAPALGILHRLRTAGVPRILERFEIHRNGNLFTWIGPDYEPAEHREPMVLCGGTAPALNYLALNGIHVDWLHSPVRNLTTLDLRRIALHACPGVLRFREILRASPQLRKLALCCAGPRPDEDEAEDCAGDQPVILGHLEELVLGEFSPSYGIFIMKHIRAPSTRQLTITNMMGNDYGPLISVFIDKFSEVRSLTIYSFDMPDTPTNRCLMARWIHSMPRVGYLRVAKVKSHWLDLFSATPSLYGLEAAGPYSTPPPNRELITIARDVANLRSPTSTSHTNPLLPTVYQAAASAPTASTSQVPISLSSIIPSSRSIVAPDVDTRAHLARIPQDVIETPRSQMPLRTGCRTPSPTPRTTVLCSQLEVLEWQQMDPPSIILFAHHRKHLGFPLTKMYVNSIWIPFAGEPFWKALQSEGKALTRSGVWPIARGDMAPEERAILAER
jgi:hypothetical protein